MTDPADLSQLADISVPAPVPWWPPAPGWWILAMAALAALMILAMAAIRRYRRNAYRRAALAELAAVGPLDNPARVAAASAILKRAALAAYPRRDVASLTGAQWMAFLDRTGSTDAFSRGSAAQLAQAAFGAPLANEPAARAACRHWLKRHRAGD